MIFSHVKKRFEEIKIRHTLKKGFYGFLNGSVKVQGYQ